MFSRSVQPPRMNGSWGANAVTRGRRCFAEVVNGAVTAEHPRLLLMVSPKLLLFNGEKKDEDGGDDLGDDLDNDLDAADDDVAGSSPKMARRRLLFPTAFGPTTATTSPTRQLTLTPDNT
mmetsp:Transcript_1385/g.2954  ORF Transcript_1385/g.2954 Transcript_1385/m.2954 type:complete len:120 (-) Transcript_1385:782-1141(-)